MNETIRFGVVGLGFGEHHVRTIANLAGARVAAAADTEPGRVDRIATMYGARGFGDAIAMIDSSGIDALSVCVSPKYREPILRAAVAKGLPIIVEKPWASDTRHALQLEEICRNATAPVMTAFSFRFHPAVRKAQELLAGPLGAPWMANGDYVFEWLVPTESWLWDPANGNGVFNENSCHLFDVVCALLGEPESVFAFGSRVVERPSEIATAIVLRFKGNGDAAGPACAITAGGIGSAANHNYPRLDLYSEHGYLRLSGYDHTWYSVDWSIRGDQTERRFVAPPEELGRTRYSDALDHFVNCIRTGTTPESTIADGIRSVRIADAIRRSFVGRTTESV